MSTPDSNVLTRYQAYRTRRFLENDARTRNWLPNWRNRRRRRILVLALAATFVALLIIAILSLFWDWAPVLWVPATVLFIGTWSTLQIVSGRQSDAPMGALDEWEIQQRNEARSIGLTITSSAVLVAVMALILLSNGIDSEELAYAGGLWTLVALLFGGCSPAMILAWITPDPDPEDL
ncbi:hypothetical protein QMK17_10995 [Rhodococcus sp. G-MC3]|uniref:hypothetical protein n=1 Tax=Rhodococcus sp. G-MC3 TaxID=3046209 RepID=UPI0024B9948E|nr:hypothetical protein [Rhodococcus sp. G-MC3]MDJ0393857.1 hypothetical protein [Rhodococcus sp. G-MC3]